MSGGEHGWGFCEARVRLPEILFQRIVNAYISTAYYAGVAMVGKRFDKDSEVISVDAWKAAFYEEDIASVFEIFFCDALPENYEQIIKDEVRKHPLRHTAPATIPLSSAVAKIQWGEFATRFMSLEKEVEEWASANIEKLPNALPNFGERFGEDEEYEDD